MTPTRTTTRKTSSKRAPKAAKPSARARLTLDETMRALEHAGSEQTRKTWLRHGAREPLFGVSFAALKKLVKRIGVDHELALELWDTGNHDARVLAVKIADPARMTPAQLDRWAASMPLWSGYVAMLAAEGPHGAAKASQWLDSKNEALRANGWLLVGLLASLDETASDDVFVPLLARIERSIHDAPNVERDPMNTALISIGGRSPALRKAAVAAAKRIGKVEIDYGDTDCKTREAVPYLEKMWAHAAAKKFATPAAQERARESMRTRC